jgi:hypothetical protein
MNFVPDELEGRIFFDGQAVALFPIDPSYVHPLMDETILTLLRTIIDMQIIFVIPEVYARVLPSSTPESPSLSEYEVQTRYLSIEWAKRLVRRLWSKGGNVHQRIRLLPTPLSDIRLIQLMRKVDMILDTFPIGGSLHPLGLALSVGTPIITLNSGVLIPYSSNDLHELKKMLASFQGKERYSHNAVYQYLMLHNSSLPWISSVSSVSAFYKNIGLEKELVANSLQEYIKLAQELATNREKAYDIRIRLLDAIDESQLLSSSSSKNKKPVWNKSSNILDDTMKDLER